MNIIHMRSTKSQKTRSYKACVYMLSLLIVFRSECIDYVEGV